MCPGFQQHCLPYFYTWCDPSANLECRSEICCTQLAENAAPKKITKNSPSGHHRATLSGYVFATKACIDNRKNLLNSNISLTCPYNMVNFGPLAAESVSLVWCMPANFNGLCVLGALLHGTLVLGISETLQHWTEAPPIFSRMAITLGIGQHSSWV